MGRVIIGQDDNGATIALDLELLLRSRLLIQANSGGGKSWLIRRLAELLFGKVPVIIIDPEGEYATLREKFDYVLVGKGGDTPADIRSAALLAQRLLELHASAVCDLFEMTPADRHEWVKRFLEAMIDAPKKLWQRCVIIVDEAHLFAPERGHGESVASGAMTDLAGRGRKRGYGVIMATQRLGKLRKDVAAELLNVLVGHTFVDVDRERAADALGVGRSDREAFFKTIKTFRAGQFYALGRALDALDRRVVRVGPVLTTHPEPGSAKHAAAPPPSPAKVRALLPKLSDLPAEAEQKEQTTRQMKAEIADLKRQIAAAVKSAPAISGLAPAKTVEVPALTAKDRAAIEKAAAHFEAASTRLDALAERCLTAAGETLQKTFERLGDLRDDARRHAVGAAEHAIELRKLLTAKLAPATRGPVLPAEPRMPPPAPAQRMPARRVEATATVSTNGDAGHLPAGERRVLIAIAQYPGVERDGLSVLSGYKKSSRDTYVSRLLAREFVAVTAGALSATDAGIAALGNFEPLPTGNALVSYWQERLPEGERKVFAALLSLSNGSRTNVPRAEIQDASGYKKSSADTYLSRLTARRLVIAERGSCVRLSETLFD